MAKTEKQKELDNLLQKTKEYLEELKKYPYKDISEYSRVVQAVKQFSDYGIWEEYDEES